MTTPGVHTHEFLFLGMGFFIVDVVLFVADQLLTRSEQEHDDEEFIEKFAEAIYTRIKDTFFLELRGILRGESNEIE